MAILKITHESSSPSAIEGRTLIFPDSAGALHALSKLDGTTTDAIITSSVINNVNSGRLTLTTATPVLTTDVAGATTVFYTPYTGNIISLYYDGLWSIYPFEELSVTWVGATASRPYDIFLSWSGSAVVMEKLIWTSATARATALVYKDGALVKSDDATRKYVGTVFTNASGGQTDVIFGKTAAVGGSWPRCYIWNMYNREVGSFINIENEVSYTYTTATWRATNNSALNRFSFVIGRSIDAVQGGFTAIATNGAGAAARQIRLCLNSAAGLNGIGSAGYTGVVGLTQIVSVGSVLPAEGYNYISQCEHSGASGTTTWYGSPDYSLSTFDHSY